MATTTLTPCMKSFLKFLTARVRQQIKALLQSYKTLLEIQIAALGAKIARMDIVQNFYNAQLNALNVLLKPYESQLAMWPFEEFKSCAELSGILGDIQTDYGKFKGRILGKTYQIAQHGFATKYFVQLRDAAQSRLDQVTSYIEYIENIAMLDLTAGQAVYVYTQNTDANGKKYPVTKKGTVASVGATTVSVNVDGEGTQSFSFSEVQPRSA